MSAPVDTTSESDDVAEERQAFLAGTPGGSRGGQRPRKPLQWSEVIWVTLTCALISVLGYSSQLAIIMPYYRSTPSFTRSTLLAVLVPFNVGLGLIFYNYYLCVSTDPGSVPAGWEPDWTALDPEGDDTPLHLKQVIYRPRYCKTCVAYKPPRAHHCRTCGKCVLRMDHHCPWVANCVGFHNYRHFIRFLFWVDVTCLCHLVIVTLRVLDRFNTAGYWREPTSREVIWMVVNYTLCIPVILLVGGFSCYHFYCIATNQTTIESWEKDRVQTMIRRGKLRKIKYPYNLGTWHNIATMLGDNPVLWCLPVTASKTADGLLYDVADGIDKGAQYRWPPKDPAKQSCGHSQHTEHYAPPLFPEAGPGSAFTYGGNGFNPSLQPSNSAMRHRTYTEPQEEEYDDDEERLSSISSGSDDDIDVHYTHNLTPTQYDSEDDSYRPTTVKIRRGSEGFEVRPRAWVI